MIIIKALLSFISNIGIFISNSGIRIPLSDKVADKSFNFILPGPWRDKYIKEHLSDSAFEIEVKRCKRKEVYVQPRLTDTSPYISDNSIQNQHLWKQNLNAYFIDKIFKESNDDDKVFCILADTGMGKTTALVNLFYTYVNKYNKTNLPFEIRLLSFTDENIFDWYFIDEPDKTARLNEWKYFKNDWGGNFGFLFEDGASMELGFAIAEFVDLPEEVQLACIEIDWVAIEN